MLSKQALEDCISKIRPYVREGFVTYLFAPIFSCVDTLRIEYDDEGKRKLYIRDISTWKEHKYIDHNLESILASSGYPILQSVSKPQLRNVLVECSLLKLKTSSVLIATSCLFSKFKTLDQSSHPDQLMMLPDHCLSLFPFFVEVDFTGVSPKNAIPFLQSIETEISKILEQEEPSQMLSGLPEVRLMKVSRNYPVIPGSLINGLIFVKSIVE